MSFRRLSVIALLACPMWLLACTETPPPRPVEQAPAVPPTDPPATVPTDPTPAVAPPVVEAKPTPPPKPGKEKIVGKWQFSFEGEPKAKAEEDAKKKFPKEKDAAKREAMLKQIADAASGEWIEFAEGFYVSHATVKGKDKVVMKMKYDVSKDEGGKLAMKGVGKDEVSKKEMKDEIAVAFVDDDTITMADPKKKVTLTFKRK